MNDWHPDLLIARHRIEERIAEADRERLARSAARRRSPLRLRVHLDFQLTLGRAAEAPGPV